MKNINEKVQSFLKYEVPLNYLSYLIIKVNQSKIYDLYNQLKEI